MQLASRTTMAELQSTLSKMSLPVCCVEALPEFGVKWRELSRAVRNARLAMTPASVARVLCKHISKHLPEDELQEILARLRLKLVATQSRVWHVIKLIDGAPQQMSTLTRMLPYRLSDALKNIGKQNAVVQTYNLGDMVYMSVSVVSASKAGTTLYVAAPPGERVALVSTTAAKTLLKAVVIALGFKGYEDENLYGRDIKSLLKIQDRAENEDNINHLTEMPRYAPLPVITKAGIDFTNKAYDDHYVDNLLGPNPPLLTDLNIQTSKAFFDVSMLNKTINLTINLKSEDVGKTLKSWVHKKALAPTSEFFQFFHTMKSNKFVYTHDDD